MFRMKVFFAVLAIMVMLPVLAPDVSAADNKHQKFVPKYDGTESCTRCHKNSAKEVAESLHYQQYAVPQFVEGWEKGKYAGMLDTY